MLFLGLITEGFDGEYRVGLGKSTLVICDSITLVIGF